MTDEEKAIELTSKSFELGKDKVEWFCSTYKNSRMSEIHTFYNGVFVGLAEGRKKDIARLEKEIAELKAQIEKMKNKLNCAKYHYCLCKDKVCKDCNDWKLETR